jgi:membrane associated rhomboid family serine protease
MGIYSRDYIREDRSAWGGAWLHSGCKWLMIANVAVYVLQLLFTTRGEPIPVPGGFIHQHGHVVTEIFDLDPELVFHGQVWRLITYAFCHDTSTPWHLIFNMLGLWWFGTTLEQMYGTREFVLFYFVAALVSGLSFALLQLVLGEMTPAIGASGAVMAVLVLYAIHFPRQQIYVMWVIPIQIRFLVIMCVIFDLFPVLQALGGERNHDSVAHAAHLGGLAFGFAYYRFGIRLDRFYSQIKLKAPRRVRRTTVRRRPESIRIYEPPEEPVDLDVQVDKILEKIQAHGEGSLSEQERDVLRKASERYKSHQRGH